ncbi:hypothetical protein EJ08DRAFT_661092 [Tothia fuscella]|uniref:Uncharacterized protein n=1 Tax=Tothia fuscella TaxID=1048955 RepID=A0A9P4NQC1_9PEZI|nr:hypothetical protein EJ08DRAFT_661092 [Tothia fuscella]
MSSIQPLDDAQRADIEERFRLFKLEEEEFREADEERRRSVKATFSELIDELRQERQEEMERREYEDLPALIPGGHGETGGGWFEQFHNALDMMDEARAEGNEHVRFEDAWNAIQGALAEDATVEEDHHATPPPPAPYELSDGIYWAIDDHYIGAQEVDRPASSSGSEAEDSESDSDEYPEEDPEDEDYYDQYESAAFLTEEMMRHHVLDEEYGGTSQWEYDNDNFIPLESWEVDEATGALLATIALSGRQDYAVGNADNTDGDPSADVW